MRRLLYTYDALHRFFEAKKTQKAISLLLILIFVFSLLGIELNKFGLLPEWVSQRTPSNHFASVALVFTMVLLVEVIGLIFTIAYSVSKTLQMQLEILALIMIRQAFKGLSTMEESFFLEPDVEIVWNIILPALSGMVIFVCISLFHLFNKLPRFHVREDSLYEYICTKKIISLLILAGVISIALYMPYKKYILLQEPHFFESLYSLLIFADILLVLVSQYYFPSFLNMFRNSAFVVCTLFIRIALTSQVGWMCAIGCFAGIYALLTAWLTQYFSIKSKELQEAEAQYVESRNKGKHHTL